MGNTLTPEVLAVFADNLQGMNKEALFNPLKHRRLAQALGSVGETAGSFGENIIGTLRRFTQSPAKSIAEGYRAMAPRTEAHRQRLSAMRRATGVGRGPEVGAREFEQAARAAATAPREGVGKYLLPETILGRKVVPRTLFRPGAHLAEHTSKPLPKLQILRGGVEGAQTIPQRIKLMAEELSRSGWTGKGGVTKYIPVGQKGQIALMSAPAIPAIVSAPAASPTGEGAALEQGLGELGSLGGMVAGGGLGLPGMALWGAGHYGGQYAGRLLDRLRAGASLPQALMAPSPEEAAKQLQTIKRYYG